MTTACLCEVDRPGLAAALAARGVKVQRTCRRTVAGLRPPAGSVLVAASPAGDHPLHHLRAVWLGPLLVMLAGAGMTEITAALDAGIEDAVTDRADDALVAARVAALARRHRAALTVEVGALVIDPLTRAATRQGRAIDLLPREYAVLLHLARSAGRVVGRAELLETIWGLGFDPGTNVVEVHISRLRAKLDHGFPAPMLLTERGRGYRLAAA